MLVGVVTVLGVILLYGFDDSTIKLGRYVMSLGLFGFAGEAGARRAPWVGGSDGGSAGGFTNWLAVTMLFTRIPFVVGSGVIPVRFVSIRETVKDVILDNFFDVAFLGEYLGKKLKEMGGSVDATAQVNSLLAGDDFDRQLDERLEGLGQLPEFAPIIAMGMQPASLKPMIKPFVIELALDVSPVLKDKLTDIDFIVNIEDVRGAIEAYLNARIQTLTAEKVTRLLSFVIRDHLDWLVVWGCVFGSIIGVLSEAVDLTPNYV